MASSSRQSPTLRRRRLGSELRRLREAAGFTIDEVAARVECSASKISRIETARVGATVGDVRHLITLFDVTGEQRQALLQLAREARQKAWWDSYNDIDDAKTLIGWEDAAVWIRTFEALLIPGLLQIKEYARTIIATMLPQLSSQELDHRVEFRMRRQSLLTRNDPSALWAVLDEAVLRRIVGDREIMQQQLRHLAEAASLPNVTLQVLPFEAGKYVGMTGAFTIYSYPESSDHDLVFVEHTGGNLYLESAQEIQKHASRFDELRAVALGPEDSSTLLTRLIQ